MRDVGDNGKEAKAGRGQKRRRLGAGAAAEEAAAGRVKQGLEDEDSDYEDEMDRAKAVRSKVLSNEVDSHVVQRTKTRGKKVSAKDNEAEAPPMPEDKEDDGLWRPDEEYDFLLRVSGSKTMSDTMKAALVNMSDQCSLMIRKNDGFQGIVVHAQDLAQGPTVVIRAKIGCVVEGADADGTSLSCTSKALQNLIGRGSDAGGAMTLYKIKNEELLRCHAGDDRKGAVGCEFDGGISLSVFDGNVPPIPPIVNEISISAPIRVVSKIFKDAITDSKLGDGGADSSNILVNLSYEMYKDEMKGRPDVNVGRLILSYDMGTSLQACSMVVCYAETKPGSYTVLPDHPTDEERFELKLSHNIRAPVVSPMLSALGNKARLVISTSPTDEKVILRCNTSGDASVAMIVGTTPDEDDDETY